MPDFRDLTLYVIRHGECEHNVAGRVAGQNDSPLTATGRTQARANGALLAQVAGDLSSFGFFASPQHRAASTMELVREGAALSTTGYIADRRLMEIDFGDHTWMTMAELDAGGHKRLSAQNWDYRRPDGESWADVHARVGRFLDALSSNAVIVTHGGTARMVRGHYLGLRSEDILRYSAPHAGIMCLSQGTETYFGA
jgi:probable phosphoglycerate mutase